MNTYQIIVLKSDNITKLDVGVRILQRMGFDWNEAVISNGMTNAPDRDKTTSIGVMIKANGDGTIYRQMEDLAAMARKHSTVCSSVDEFLEALQPLMNKLYHPLY